VIPTHILAASALLVLPLRTPDTPSLHAARAERDIRLDVRLEEAIWRTADSS